MYNKYHYRKIGIFQGSNTSKKVGKTHGKLLLTVKMNVEHCC